MRLERYDPSSPIPQGVWVLAAWAADGDLTPYPTLVSDDGYYWKVSISPHDGRPNMECLRDAPTHWRYV